MTTVIFFGGVFAACSGTMEHIAVEDNILDYENYNRYSIVLPEKYLDNLKDIYFTGDIIDGRAVSEAQRNRITGELFDFLCHLEIINGWQAIDWSGWQTPIEIKYNMDYKEHIEQRKKRFQLFYLGKLDLSESFDSYLIMVSAHMEEDELFYSLNPNCEYGDVFLINITDNMGATDNYITSITRMCSYVNYNNFDSQANSLIFTERKGNVFIQRENLGLLASDQVFPDGMEIEKSESIVKFTYDETGRLRVLKSIRKTYMEAWDKDFADD